MGRGVLAFIVPGHQLAGIAEHSTYRLQTSLEAAESWLSELDEELEPGEAPHRRAVEQLYAGELSGETANSTYRRAFKALCMAWPKFPGPMCLPNDRLFPVSSDFLAELDVALSGHSVPLSMVELVASSPVRFPGLGEPSVGHWTMETIEEASGPLTRMLEEDQDADHLAALRQASEWLGTARKVDRLWGIVRDSAPNRPVVVGFY